MKILLLLVLFVSPAISQTLSERASKLPNAGEFKIEYDKFKDISEVSVSGKSKAGSKSAANAYELGVRAFFIVPGHDLASDVQTFWVTFHNYDRSWVFLRNHHLIFIADGKRLDLGSGDHQSDTSLSGVTEEITFAVDRATFSQIVGAETIELQLGPFEGTITDFAKFKTRRKMKDLLMLGTK